MIENKLLDVEREYNIAKILRHNWDTLACLMLIFVVLGIGYNSPAFFIPLVILAMLFVVMDDVYEQTKDRNDIKINHALKQNAYFELVQANAQDMMDILEKQKEYKDRVMELNEEYARSKGLSI